ncbi:hypothetical protein PPYR_00750 [Photinus pyralis]|uniref:MYND-type domain-containing protein n=1 Tax=Photinus pyralis TaxID=7054 RepID=A0A5N4B304_PHOPY|nr:zinc finger MYND domain-containing protein 10 [Photinus pyralis]KAB0803780.1 hypothetical protein PPYR_00750 [Photinus pyralis]
MDSILLSTEIDLYIDTMKAQDMASLGSKSWLEWHQRLQKLNQEALIEAAAVKEEYVQEALVSFGKIMILVHEAILSNVWKRKVLPLLLRMENDPPCTFVAYSVLYHEAVCVALLELVTYHANAAQALGDAAADLLHYSYGTVSQLLVLKENSENEDNSKVELIRQRDDLAFDIGIRSLTILRYLGDCLDRLPLAVTARMFGIDDVPVLLTQMLVERPWIRKGKQYVGGKWMDWDGESVAKVEAQVWLALRQLLLDPSCPSHYNITDARRRQLMRLQQFLTPVLIDQISPLIELQQWVYRLSVADQPCAPPVPILLEVMLEIQDRIMATCEGKWKKIARQQLPQIFSKNHDDIVQTAQCLSEAYNAELLEKLEDINKKPEKSCVKCGKGAMQRCSRCKSIWYCSRNCQVTHWSTHKDDCNAA